MFAIELTALAQIITARRNGAAMQQNRDGWVEIFVRAIAISFALVVALCGWFLFEKPWMGIKQNGDKMIQVGRYRSLDACRKDVAKLGGNWCGKYCKNYGQGSIADCKPLVPVS